MVCEIFKCKQFAVGAINIQGFESKMGLNESNANILSNENYREFYVFNEVIKKVQKLKSWNRYFNLFDHAQLNKA